MTTVSIEQEMEITLLAKKIEAATDRNDHTGARRMLADKLGGKYPDIMKGISLIHEAEGHIPIDVSRYRQHITAEMLEDAERQWGKQMANLIKSSF